MDNTYTVLPHIMQFVKIIGIQIQDIPKTFTLYRIMSVDISKRHAF